MDTPELMKTIRLQLGLSQDEFARAIHVAFSTVNRWENNRSTPNSMARALIIDYCEKTVLIRNLLKRLKKAKGGDNGADSLPCFRQSSGA